MRTKLFFYSISLLTLFSACSKVIIYEPSAEEIELYSQIYMPRAERGAVSVPLSLAEQQLTFTYNAFLGGPIDARNDISVRFGVDPNKVAAYNETNNTDYQLLPEEAYELEVTHATIGAGQRTTGDFQLKIVSGPHLELFQNYLLPISILDAENSVNNMLATTYYLFSVSYEPGKVPRELVLSMGSNWGNILSNGVRGTLIRRDANNDILVYEPDEQGVFSAAPQVAGINWDASESFYYVNENTIVVRNYPYWAGLFNFRVDDDYVLHGADPFWLGDFWDQFRLIPFNDFFLTVDGGGVMRRQPALTDVNAPKTEVGSGFGGFKQLLAYDDSLLALAHDGRLWLYEMSDQAVPGPRRQVGSGWEMYQQIIVSGSDILALDGAGDVYRYKFNPNGFFPLK
ncbi:DUF1735 domain-containing protein [Parapedobacter deserti]|uniref:DUF1735 domain-containing protein n=1 Tax=Parapedobacter deserti TaxID=1912957 RepID=A0ABV7JPA6_9SPHI